MTLPSLAIVIVSYNSAKWLERCLTTLLENIHHYPQKVEWGVVENGAQAETMQLAQRFVKEGLKWLPTPQNLGYGGAANYGWENLAGEVCIVFNPDMSFPAGWLLKFVAPFARDVQIGVVGCKLLYEDGLVQHAGGIVKYGAALIETFGQGEPDDGRWDEGSEVEFVTGAALAVRREIVAQLEGFDAEFFPGYFEDVDLCYRVNQAGWRVWYEGAATAYHYEGRSFGRSTAYYQAFHRNRLRFILKHYSAQRVFGEFLPAERARLRNTTEQTDRLAGSAVYQSQKITNLGETMSANNPQREDQTIARLTKRIAEVKQRWLIEEKPFHSQLPFVATIRERINSLSTKWYVKPILAQQIEYNAAVSRTLEDLGNLVTGKVIADDLETAALASRLTALEERLTRIENLLEVLTHQTNLAQG
ncbi:MAG: glycosyltransferase family 2 protein [Chloroflexi bacterium]|nr:glycosyltransferase family 2 protein [Chloroflexota bacterium]